MWGTDLGDGESTKIGAIFMPLNYYKIRVNLRKDRTFLIKNFQRNRRKTYATRKCIRGIMEHIPDKNEEKRKLYREQYGNIIRKKRRKRNITQKELAAEIGVTDATISRYEKGELEMPASILPVISEFCKFNFRDYMEGFDLIRLSRRLDEIEMYGYTRKAAYPLPEWNEEYCRNERDLLIQELMLCLEKSDSRELLCLASLFDVLQSYKEAGMTESMGEVEKLVVSYAKKELSKIPELQELVFKITALTMTIESMESKDNG